jgi:hypothetical protein
MFTPWNYSYNLYVSVWETKYVITFHQTLHTTFTPLLLHSWYVMASDLDPEAGCVDAFFFLWFYSVPPGKYWYSVR